MKYIEKHYQDLIEQLESAHGYVVDDLKAHINWLEKKLAEHDADPLTEELKEYIRLEGECEGSDARIKKLTEENEKLKAEIASLKKTTVKVKAPEKRTRKQVLCVCKDCGTYFYAQRKDAQRCPECKRKHGSKLKKAWYKKHNL